MILGNFEPLYAIILKMRNEDNYKLATTLEGESLSEAKADFKTWLKTDEYDVKLVELKAVDIEDIF